MSCASAAFAEYPLLIAIVHACVALALVEALLVPLTKVAITSVVAMTTTLKALLDMFNFRLPPS
jgi:hypothetical protein